MKKIIGIVAEYNPFHAGHAYHILQSRLSVGAEDDCVVVCVMSGDFVQRGEWAIQPKSDRAQQAVCGGADVVFELPLPWCLSSAGIFASSAVDMLLSLGCTHLSFGSESGDIEKLSSAAEMMEQPGFEKAISDELKNDPRLTYPAAMSKVIGNDVISSPNDLLAISYLRELYRKRKTGEAETKVICIQRIGTPHDAPGEAIFNDSGFPSASQLRRAVYSGKMDLSHVNRDILSIAAVSRLRLLSKADFNLLPDCANGLGNRIYEAVCQSSSLNEIYDLAKTRAFTHSRVRRAVMCAVLGICEGDNSGYPPYARILAMNQRGMDYLSAVKDTAKVRIINRPKEISSTDEHTKQLFAIGSAAHDFYMLGFGEKCNQRCNEDYRTTPFVVQNKQT